jgi:hypothetical protein
MAIDLPILLVIAVAALFVASSAARRAADHADRVAGRRPVPNAARRGPIGALVDLVDESVAVYTIRQRLGLSTRTRAERRADEARAALVAHADEIRQSRTGALPPVRPTHLVVAGRAGEPATPWPRGSIPRPRSSTLRSELIAAGVGLFLVVGVVAALAPRGSGGVLSATGVPASTAPAIPTPTPSPSPPPSTSLEPVAT